MRLRAVLAAVAASSLSPIVALPAFGGDGPANPAAARQEIIALFDSIAALTDGADVAAHLDLIDDPRGVVHAAHQAYAAFPQEVTSDAYRIHDVRFTSSTDAVVTYDILVFDLVYVAGRTGHAVFRDGRWKITRETACGNLGLAGGNCDGGEPCVVVTGRHAVPFEQRTGFCGPAAATPMVAAPNFTG